MLTPSTTYGALLKNVQAAAQKTGVKILVAEASTPQEIENAFSMMVREKADAVIVGLRRYLLSSTDRSRNWHPSTGCHRCSQVR